MGSAATGELKAPVAITAHELYIFRWVRCRKTPALWCLQPPPNPHGSVSWFVVLCETKFRQSNSLHKPGMCNSIFRYQNSIPVLKMAKGNISQKFCPRTLIHACSALMKRGANFACRKSCTRNLPAAAHGMAWHGMACARARYEISDSYDMI